MSENVVAQGFVSRASYFTAPRIFGLSLIVATAIPFVAGGIQWLTGASPTLSLRAVIAFLAGIHVPLTLYLLFDRRIRQFMRSRPWGLIGVPILIFAICFTVFLGSASSRDSGTATFLVYFSLFVLAWNLWHFGKQNIGVYSFFRISQSKSGMLPIEKRAILIGSALGVMTTFALGGDGYIKQFASNVDMGWLSSAYAYISQSGTYLQYLLFAATAYFVIANWRRFGASTALIFLLCSNYFFPQYMLANDATWTWIFACNTLGHGVQYCVFLGFHAAHPDNDIAQGDFSPKQRIYMISAFILTVLLISDLFVFNTVLSFSNLTGGISNRLGMGASGATAIGDAIVTGILLNHFWLDSYFWRFKDPESRGWIMSRYSFLFQKRA